MCKLLLKFFLSLRVIFLLFFHFCVISHDFRNYIYFNHNISNGYMYTYTYILKGSHIISSSIFNMVRNIKLFLENKWEIFCHIVVTWIMYYILIEKLYFVNHYFLSSHQYFVYLLSQGMFCFLFHAPQASIKTKIYYSLTLSQLTLSLTKWESGMDLYILPNVK